MAEIWIERKRKSRCDDENASKSINNMLIINCMQKTTPAILRAIALPAVLQATLGF
jgi:hypothetical protein